MAVKIRMKMMGRKHRPFFRICAIDSRNPRDGRVLEELGTYDPHVPNTDERVKLVPDRVVPAAVGRSGSSRVPGRRQRAQGLTLTPRMRA